MEKSGIHGTAVHSYDRRYCRRLFRRSTSIVMHYYSRDDQQSQIQLQIIDRDQFSLKRIQECAIGLDFCDKQCNKSNNSCKIISIPSLLVIY